MMKKSKRMIFVTALIAAMLTAGSYTVNQVYAQDTSTQETLVQMIAQKFSLNEAEVQTVFEQYRAKHQQEMQARYEEKLSTAVKEGKLTEAQKNLLIAKHKEIQAEKLARLESIKSLSPSERRSTLQKKKTELKAWAETNGIDLQYLLPGFGHTGQGFGRKMHTQ